MTTNWRLRHEIWWNKFDRSHKIGVDGEWNRVEKKRPAVTIIIRTCFDFIPCRVSPIDHIRSLLWRSKFLCVIHIDQHQSKVVWHAKRPMNNVKLVVEFDQRDERAYFKTRNDQNSLSIFCLALSSWLQPIFDLSLKTQHQRVRFVSQLELRSEPH